MVYGMRRRTYPTRRYRGRFFGRRVNCERVPQLPAALIRWVLDDPRKIPYLLVWKNSDDVIQEAVRIARHSEENPFVRDWQDWVEVKRTDGTRLLVRGIRRTLPRNRGYVLLMACPTCGRPCRSLYGWEAGGEYTNSARVAPWRCRTCAGLRYASEGGALVLRSRGSWFRSLELQYGMTRSDRPERWHPYVTTRPH